MATVEFRKLVKRYGTLEVVHAIDLTITPDTSAFSFVDFDKASELAEAGQAAAEKCMPQLMQVLGVKTK